MSIVVKKIGSKRYVYRAFRRGRTVMHQYLGPLSEPRVQQIVAENQAEKQIPQHCHYLFWDRNPGEIDIRANASYVIERVLELGDLDALWWLQRIYPTRLIMDTGEVSRKLSEKSKNFWRLWFGANNHSR